MDDLHLSTIRLASASELDIKKTFECGQCFRWNADDEGVYTGLAMGRPARVWQQEGAVYLRSAADKKMWRQYFDMDRDYDKISRSFSGSKYLDRCVEYGRGIRILRQEPWETLCSFIISQCNNIARIKGIVERLCAMFGDEIEFEGELYYSFPSAQRIALLELSELAPLRCGYRAPYIISAARSLENGDIRLEELIDASAQQAQSALMALAGVGAKVANCVVLFGLYHLEAFPIDVWIKRALERHFPPGFDPKSLGEYAGLAQQYIFYYARSGGK